MKEVSLAATEGQTPQPTPPRAAGSICLAAWWW